MIAIELFQLIKYFTILKHEIIEFKKRLISFYCSLLGFNEINICSCRSFVASDQICFLLVLSYILSSSKHIYNKNKIKRNKNFKLKKNHDWQLVALVADWRLETLVGGGGWVAHSGECRCRFHWWVLGEMKNVL